MKREIFGILLLVAMIGFLSAADEITTPMSFYGQITNNGTAIGSGCYMELTTSYETEKCLIRNGNYGYIPEVCIVETDNLAGEKVQFYLNGNKIGESAFFEKQQINLNFDINFNPECTPIPENNQTNNQTNNTNPGDGGNSGGGGGGGGGGSSGSQNLVVKISDSNASASRNSEEKCTENWACYSWSDIDGKCGERECVDLNDCGTETSKPETIKTCEENGKSGLLSGITGDVIGGLNSFMKSKSAVPLLLALIVVVIAFFYFGLRKKTA